MLTTSLARHMFPLASRRQHKLITRSAHRLQNCRRAYLRSLLTPVCLVTKRCFHPGISGDLTRDPALSNVGRAITNRFMLKQMLGYVWPRGAWRIRARVVAAFVCLVAAKACSVTFPLILKNATDALNTYSPVQLSMETVPVAIVSTGVALLIAYGAVRAGNSLFTELRSFVFARVAHYSIRSISRKVFMHLHSLDLRFHQSQQIGSISKAIDRGTRGMAFVLSAFVFSVLPTAFELSIAGAMMNYYGGPAYVAVMLGTVGCYSVFTYAITQRRIEIRRTMNQADNEAGNRCFDSLQNFESVKYFNNERFEADRYTHSLKQFEQASVKTTTSLAALNFGQNVIYSAGLIGVLWLAANDIMTGAQTIGHLVFVNGLMFQISMPLNFFGSLYREIKQGLIDMQTMFGLLTIQPSIVNAVQAAPLQLTGASDATITFENVTFGYSPDNLILKNVSFTIPANGKIGIVGGSGSGKSTIVRLLYRFYDPLEGRILINGQDIRQVTLDSLRAAIGIVPQDCGLFHDTISYNIRYGNIEASDEQVKVAARAADLHSFVDRVGGFDTIVGERGSQLSGGEKQRVAIARAVLKNAPIAVYDEATSNLDSITESNIMTSMRRAMADRTSLYIAHRLATIADCDEILVLNEGTLAERGTHSALLARNAIYANLWRVQHQRSSKDEEERKAKAKEAEEKERELQALLAQMDGGKECCRGTGQRR